MSLEPGDSSGVAWLAMSEGEDWLFRPVRAGMIRGESLLQTEIDLDFVAACNEALDVEVMNGRLYDEAQRRK